MRCGRSGKKHEDASEMCRTKVGDGRFNAQHGRMVKITQKVLGLRATKNVTEIDEPTKAGKMDTNERGQMLIKTNCNP